MFYNSSSFKALEGGVQLSWLQQQIANQNIANIETPGYKSRDLSFSAVLEEYENGEKKAQPEITQVNARINTSDAVSTRADGNNVDAEAEYLALYKAYAQYSLLLDKIKGEFDKYNTVLGANM